MTIRTVTDFVAQSYHVQLELEPVPNALTPVEREAIAYAGELLIDCGGTISLGEGSFEMPTNERRFPSQFPVKAIFSTVDFEDATQRAAAWPSAIKSRLETAMEAARTEAATVQGVGVNVETIITNP